MNHLGSLLQLSKNHVNNSLLFVLSFHWSVSEKKLRQCFAIRFEWEDNQPIANSVQTNLSNPWNLLVIGNLGYYKPLQAIAIDNKLKSSKLRNLDQRWPTLNLLKGCCCCLLGDFVSSVLPNFQINTWIVMDRTKFEVRCSIVRSQK